MKIKQHTCFVLIILLFSFISNVTCWADPIQVQPLLSLEVKNIDEVIPGGEFFLSLTVSNISNNPAFEVCLEMQLLDLQGEISETTDPFSFKNKEDQEKVIEKIEGNETFTWNIPIVVAEDALDRDYCLRLNLIGKDSYFEETVHSTTTITVPVGYGSLIPQVSVKEVVFTPPDPNLVEPFAAAIILENKSRIDIRDLSLELDGLENFEITDLSNKRFLETIPAGSVSEAVKFTIKAAETRQSNQVKIEITYYYLGSKTETKMETLNLPLSQAALNTNPYVKIKSLQVQLAEPGKNFTLGLIVVNDGENEAREVKLTLDGGDLIYPRDGSNLIHINRLASGEEREITLEMGMNAQADLSVYQMATDITYSDLWDESYSTAETLNITAETLGVDETIVGVPRVIISKYTLSTPAVLAGNTVTLSLYVQNTSNQEVNNVKVSLGVIEIDGEKEGTVFSPVDSSNSFYLSRIGKGETVVHDIDLFVDSSSAAETYIVPVDIVYEDREGQSHTEDDIVNIPVTQEARLQLVNLELPQSAFVGQPFEVVADIANMGRVSLNNVMVSLEGDFPKENATYYFGQMEIGAGDYFEGTITPDQEGEVSGNVVLSYLDNNNQQITITEPFTVNVLSGNTRGETTGAFHQETERERAGLTAPDEGNKVSLLFVVSRYFIVFLLLAAGGVVIWRKKHLKKKDEEMLNEHI